MKQRNTINPVSGNPIKQYFAFILLLFLCLGFTQPTFAEDYPSNGPRDMKIEKLENAVKKLMDEIEALKEGEKHRQLILEKQESSLSELKNQLEEFDVANALFEDSWLNKFSLGGYGEMHANFTVGDDQDKFDIHRIVLYMGYNFNEWIKFHSEIELEHAFVSEDSDGEIGIEQAYVDFLLSNSFNVRVGRILTPLGIINQKHEPTFFNGVERPSFSKYIIPTTWSSDGIGIFGHLSEALKYEVYVVGGLNGSAFNSKNGIRGGRTKDRPGLNDPAITGRLDFFPFVRHEFGYDHRLRLGVSAFLGGLDNGTNGNNPGIDGDIKIYSGDFEYSVMDLDFKGAIAFEDIDGAREIGNGTASEIFGWFLETGYHFLPESWKKGRLEKSDAVMFVRYDDYDTQYKMPSGISENRAGDRHEWTIGMNFYPIPNFVIKADYQIREDRTDDNLDDFFNLGIGWQF